MEYDEDYKKFLLEERARRALLRERKLREQAVTLEPAEPPKVPEVVSGIIAAPILPFPDNKDVGNQEPAPPTRLPPIWSIRDSGGSG